MTELAQELLRERLEQAPPSDSKTTRQKAREVLADRSKREFVGPPILAPEEDKSALPWWKQGFDTPADARFNSPKDLARMGIGAVDMLVGGSINTAMQQIAGTAAGIGGAISPNDTYLAARERQRATDKDPLETEAGRHIARETGRAASELFATTGIPAAWEKAGLPNPVEAAQEHFPVASDLTATALLGLPTARIGRRAEQTIARPGPSGEVLREAVNTDAPVTLGTSGGSAATSVDLQAIKNPELREQLVAASRAGTLNAQAAERYIQADSLPIPVPLTEGQALADGARISWERNNRGKHPEIANRFTAQNEALAANLDVIRRETTPNVVGNDALQNGQALVDSYKAYDEALKAEVTKRYQALRDAAGGSFPVDGALWVKNAETALKENNKSRWLPAEIAGDLEDFRSGERQMTFNEFENIRTALAAEARKAERASDGNRAAAIHIVRDQLESIPMVGEAAERLKPLADAARSTARARFDRIKRDPAYAAVVDDAAGIGESSTLADDFVQKYIIRGRAANIQRMRQTLKDDPVAAETISAGALNYLKAKSGINMYTNEGGFSQAGFNRALAEISPKMRELFSSDTEELLKTLGNVARTVEYAPSGSFVNRSNTAATLLAEGAASAAEGAANVAAKGLPVGSMIRQRMGRRAEQRRVDQALSPGSALNAPTNPKKDAP